MTRNGAVIDTGAGAAALGNPARCVAWLANKLAAFGDCLHPGDIVMPGALHRMVPVRPGDVFRAEFAYLGAVTARFSNGAVTGKDRPDGRAIDRRRPDRGRAGAQGDRPVHRRRPGSRARRRDRVPGPAAWSSSTAWTAASG